MRKINRLIIIVFGLILLIFIVLNSINLETESLEEYYSYNYSLGWTDFNVCGIVVDKYINEKAHNHPTIILRDTSGQQLNFVFQTNEKEFYNYVQIGDSVLSKKNSFRAKVWNDTTFKFFDFIE